MVREYGTSKRYCTKRHNALRRGWRKARGLGEEKGRIRKRGVIHRGGWAKEGHGRKGELPKEAGLSQTQTHAKKERQHEKAYPRSRCKAKRSPGKEKNQKRVEFAPNTKAKIVSRLSKWSLARWKKARVPAGMATREVDSKQGNQGTKQERGGKPERDDNGRGARKDTEAEDRKEEGARWSTRSLP